MDHDHGVVVVMVPLPAQGHLNQLLHFSRLISSRGVPIHYIGSATHNRQVKDRVHGWDPCTMSNIYFHDYNLPSFPTPPADPNASNKFPSHLISTFEASVHLREPLSILLKSFPPTVRRIVVIHDSLTSFAAEEASFVPNAEAYSFICCSVFTVLHFIWDALGKPIDGGNLIPPDLTNISFEGCLHESFSGFAARNEEWKKFDVGDIYNTCEAIDGKFINLMVQHPMLGKTPKWAVGPLNPVVFSDETAGTRHKCLEWLHMQPPSSVIYVSFGTMTSLSDEQITEIAIGLEHSKQKFIWILRDSDRGDIYKGEAQVRKIPLPDGYEERVEGVGLIVRDWAPQPEILAHSSTGGFLTHCGWNSCIESLSMGVPMAAWPMHSDQPGNSLLVTEVLRVGLLVREWAHREEVVSSTTIERVVKKLMASEEGKEMRKKAQELGVAVRQAVSNSGSSTTQLDSFLAHISR